MIPDVLENVNPDLSDSEFMPKDELEQPEDMGTPLPLGSEAGDAPTPMGGYGDAGPSDEEGSEGSSGDIDEELAAELNQALGGDSASSSGDSEGGGGSDDDNEGRGSDEDEDEEDEFDNAEDKRAKKLLNEEIRDLEAAVEKKSTEIEQSMNPLIRVCYSFFSELREDRQLMVGSQRRFEDALRKLRTDLDLKILQRSQLIDLSRERREAAAAEAELEEGSGSDEDGNGGGRGGKSVDGTSHSHSMGMGVGVSRPMAKAVPPAINAGIREQDEDMEMGDDDDLFGADPAEDGRDMSVGGDEMDVG
jgi:transcription initiation factor TFIID subunit 7